MQEPSLGHNVLLEVMYLVSRDEEEGVGAVAILGEVHVMPAGLLEPQDLLEGVAVGLRHVGLVAIVVPVQSPYLELQRRRVVNSDLVAADARPRVGRGPQTEADARLACRMHHRPGPPRIQAAGLNARSSRPLAGGRAHGY